MSIETTILVNNYATEAVDSSWAYSEKKKGAGYHKTSSSVHTYQYQLTDFSGTIKLQGTLELYPGDNDWFDITGTEVGGDSTIIAAAVLTGNFSGNFVWVRAAYNVQNGIIASIRYNH